MYMQASFNNKVKQFRYSLNIWWKTCKTTWDALHSHWNSRCFSPPVRLGLLFLIFVFSSSSSSSSSFSSSPPPLRRRLRRLLDDSDSDYDDYSTTPTQRTYIRQSNMMFSTTDGDGTARASDGPMTTRREIPLKSLFTKRFMWSESFHMKNTCVFTLKLKQ